jgi:hypothetical protein
MRINQVPQTKGESVVRASRRLSLLALLVVAAVFLALAAPAAASAPLSGAFGTTIRGATPAALNASWAVIFLPNGAYQIDRNHLAVVIGQGTRSATTLVFTHEHGAFACKSGAGTYRWSLSGKKLTLKVVKDSCVGRRAVLTSHALVRQA